MEKIAKRNPEIVQRFREMLSAEISVYEEYIGLLKLEMEKITTNSMDVLDSINVKKEDIYIRLKERKSERLGMIDKYFPERETNRLSEVLKAGLHMADYKALEPLVNRLKKVLVESQKGTQEGRQLISFASQMVSGTLSILWSAAQNITRGYSRAGKLKEEVRPLKAQTIDRI